MFNKKDLVLKRLQNTYCRLRASQIEGVGVFAIRDIPQDVNPFEGMRQEKWVTFKVEELQNLDKEVLTLIDDFFVIEKDGTVKIPVYGPNGMDISFFVNNSDDPNMKTIDDGFTFVTSRSIEKGEELTISYATYDDTHNEKKSRYK
ncbi:hypothetical protein COU57_03515 [Candidatus Pacearchaeota archaeon CG10_big_fil_rev_8_21_14_0_10_32_14]|nr:MAG: hypothetical protein COU57_03515 [Candidatus Pacearchaeota archaeon CG10_big_fil_rev_8_21_14_0_10_32_14]